MGTVTRDRAWAGAPPARPWMHTPCGNAQAAPRAPLGLASTHPDHLSASALTDRQWLPLL